MRFYFHFGIACLSFVFFFPFRGKRLEGEGMFGRASRPGMMSAAFRAAAWKRLSDRYAKDSPQLPSTHHQLWTTLDIAFFQRLAIKRPWKNEMMSKVPVQSSKTHGGGWKTKWLNAQPRLSFSMSLRSGDSTTDDRLFYRHGSLGSWGRLALRS